MENQTIKSEKDIISDATVILKLYGHLLNFSAIEIETKLPRGTLSYVYKGKRSFSYEQARGFLYRFRSFSTQMISTIQKVIDMRIKELEE